MHLFKLAFLLPLVCAEELVIPAVQSLVKAQLQQFSKYTDYAGPTGTAKPAATPQVKVAASPKPAAAASYWYETIAHQGIQPFNSKGSSYKVYRNVKDYGAKGDGKTDDTAAIQNAISDGERCKPGSCASSSTTSAVVYFPAGTYVVSSSIVDYYYTQLIGNPNSLPTLKATTGFNGFGIIDGAQYQAGGALPYGSTNIFWRQVKNFIIDMTAIPTDSAATGIHWPTAQATSLQNIIFYMSSDAGTQHQGLFIESGSAGMLNDLVFYGGFKAVIFGNQQYTVRNLTFYNAVTAISQIWDWGWTYKSISINNCTVGLDMAQTSDAGSQTVGSVTYLDSSFTDTKVAFNISTSSASTPATGGSLVIENIALNNVSTAILYGPTKSTVLAGTAGSTMITAWATGNMYNPNGPKHIAGTITPAARPASLVSGGKYYERSKPSYANLASSSFLSVRAGGAKGDGKTDDTANLQQVIKAAASAGKVVYIDAGTYKITKTILIPKGSKLVGEGYPVLMSSGSFFSNMKSPQAVIQVGNPGDSGTVEWSDTIVSTQGAQAGAVLIKWNLASTSSNPSGLWDVHTRIGGFAGSQLTLADCPVTPSTSTINNNCIGAYMSMHITPTASGLYLENVWLWTADHDMDDPKLRQISVYSGRGMLIQSKAGNIWLVGTSVEHHVRYQYQFSNTQNIFAGQIQTETPYYQAMPGARSPFPTNTTLDDPNFDFSCPSGSAATCAKAWGLRLSASKNVLVYGAGLYSFFDNYVTSCSDVDSKTLCQTGLVQYDAKATTGFTVYNLNTIGSSGMVHRDQTRLASWSYNRNVFPSTIVMFSTI